MKKLIASLLVLLAAPAVFAADPAPAAKPYHLQLEANPAAAFPWLSKFGKVTLDVYRGGVRADTIWLDSYSKNGDANVTVLNPLGRLYVDVPIAEISPILSKLAATTAGDERKAAPEIASATKGKVLSIPATRYRLQYGPDAYIDYWTTGSIPENPQLRTIVLKVVEGIAPGTASVAKNIRGTPLFVELNFRRYKKLPIVYVKKLAWNAEDEEDALTRGPIYVRASVLEALWKD
jgi:hypothetical protein